MRHFAVSRRKNLTITQEELDSYFVEPVSAMAERNRCSFEEMKFLLKQKYDGYHFSDNMTDVYNPFSLLNALDSLRLQDYWFSSGTPTYLIRLLAHFKENMNELTGKYYRTEEFIDYKADVERCGTAIADDLPERLPDHQGL